jgi:hypothetical protein
MEIYHTSAPDESAKPALTRPDGEPWRPKSPTVNKGETFEEYHEPHCWSCKWLKETEMEGEHGYLVEVSVCARHAPNAKKSPPWPKLENVAKDVCVDYVRSTHGMCGDPTCPICTAPKGRAIQISTPKQAPPGTPKPKPETDRQREFRQAFEVMAEIHGRTDELPIGDVRAAFKAHHNVEEADPKKANKKRLDAWACALKDLPPGFEVDKAAGMIRNHSPQPLALAA